MEENYRRASLLAWELRRRRRPLAVAPAPPDGRFFLGGRGLELWEWHRGFPPHGRPVVALDIETTGLRPGWDGVTEVALVREEPGERRVFRSFANPGRPIPPKVTEITGISDRDVREAPPLEEVLQEALPLLEGAVLVMQNAPFDLGFLTGPLKRIGYRIEGRVVDTLLAARRLMPGLRSYRLANLARVLAWPGSGFHRALSDAEATLWVAHELYFLKAAGRPLALEDL